MKAKQENKLCENIYVTCRFIRESEDKDFIRSVTKYTNYQNPITQRDLHSNDSIQYDIQGILEKIGIFYERQLNEYRDLEDEKRLDALEAAQAYLCCELALPHSAKQDRRKLFTEYYPKIFDPTKSDLGYKLLISARTLEYALEKQSGSKRRKRKMLRAGKLPRERMSHLVISYGSYHIAAVLYNMFFSGKSLEELAKVTKGFDYRTKFNAKYKGIVDRMAEVLKTENIEKSRVLDFFKHNDASKFMWSP
jgi:predicted nucleic acid-binding protein